MSPPLLVDAASKFLLPYYTYKNNFKRTFPRQGLCTWSQLYVHTRREVYKTTTKITRTSPLIRTLIAVLGVSTVEMLHSFCTSFATCTCALLYCFVDLSCTQGAPVDIRASAQWLYHVDRGSHL